MNEEKVIRYRGYGFIAKSTTKLSKREFENIADEVIRGMEQLGQEKRSDTAIMYDNTLVFTMAYKLPEYEMQD